MSFSEPMMTLDKMKYMEGVEFNLQELNKIKRSVLSLNLNLYEVPDDFNDQPLITDWNFLEFSSSQIKI